MRLSGFQADENRFACNQLSEGEERPWSLPSNVLLRLAAALEALGLRRGGELLALGGGLGVDHGLDVVLGGHDQGDGVTEQPLAVVELGLVVRPALDAVQLELELRHLGDRGLGLHREGVHVDVGVGLRGGVEREARHLVHRVVGASERDLELAGLALELGQVAPDREQVALAVVGLGLGLEAVERDAQVGGHGTSWGKFPVLVCATSLGRPLWMD